MHETKHTPGPWAVQKNGVTVHSADPDLDTLICDVTGRAIDPAFFGQDDDEAEANARLIAAAPELLAACSRIVSTYHRVQDGCREAAPLLDAIDDDIEAIRAAVARATAHP